MYLMIADEADQDGSKEFLIFAGVFFPSDRISQLHNGVSKLRLKYNYQPGDLLKSSPGTKPANVSRENHTSIKNDILDLANVCECKICCYLVPHAIAKGQSHEDRLKFGTNTLLQKFDQFLREMKCDAGMAFFDPTQDFPQQKHLKETFENGVLHRDGTRIELQNVVGIDSSGIGHSHLASITDIVVGAFRFVANEPEKDKVGKILLQSLAKLMWGKVLDGQLQVRERGMCIRPRNIYTASYKADIEAFIERLVSYSKN